jgi:hypothetical protein
VPVTAPHELDGAAVVATAPVTTEDATGATRHFRDGKLANEYIRWLAVCRYADQPGVYLFYCDEDWAVLTDTFHETVEDAYSQARFEFGDVSFDLMAEPS